jgi:hypothetical protein
VTTRGGGDLVAHAPGQRIVFPLIEAESRNVPHAAVMHSISVVHGGVQSIAPSHAVGRGSQRKTSGAGPLRPMHTESTGHAVPSQSNVGTQQANGPASTLPQPSCR